MWHGYRAVLYGVAMLIATVGSVAPDEDPLSQLALLLGDSSTGLGVIGGQEVSGPISIRDSIVGDIISISVRVNSTVRTNVSLELLQIVVCALNEYGHYGIEMADNEINQDYVNILALLLSSTGDVELFHQLSHAMGETAPSTVPPNTNENGAPAPPKDEISVEEALKKLFPKLAKKQ
uniref:Secreted protein n=1 Tax=Anopheles epiroticus TaxID=199890 RepID=A0A182P859_9DIPT